MIPTPKVSRRGDCKSERKRNSPDLHSYVKMFPTPAARDYKGQNAIESLELKLESGEKAFQGQLPNFLALNGDVGSLNPSWVEWLMGFPAGWIDGKKPALTEDHWDVDPAETGEIPRVAKGVKKRADKIRCLGDAVVPQVAQLIGEMIMTHERKDTPCSAPSRR